MQRLFYHNYRYNIYDNQNYHFLPLMTSLLPFVDFFMSFVDKIWYDN